MLAGCRILVVEDEALVAETIRDLLTEAEGVPVGPAATISEARRLIKESPSLNAALLDVNLGDGLCDPCTGGPERTGRPDRGLHG
ncbi:response regulator [Microvirga aerophila]|nr:response regulator [Microvirga aerophila]